MSLKEQLAEEMLPAVDRPRIPKNRRRARSMTSFNMCADDLNAPESSVPENRDPRRHKSLSSMYIKSMVGENEQVSPSRAAAASSEFLFAEVKRRLKHLSCKEELHHQLSVANRERRARVKTMPPIASPSRDHFFIERILKPASLGVKKGNTDDDHRPAIATSEDAVRLSDGECCRESSRLESSLKLETVRQPSSTIEQHSDSTLNSVCSQENCHSARLGQYLWAESEASSSQIASAISCSVTEKIEDGELMNDATRKHSPISVLALFSEGVVSPPGIKSISAIQSRQFQFEEEISAPSLERLPWHNTDMEDVVNEMVEMSGLTWDELHRRVLLLYEVDFPPNLPSCDVNLLFDLVNEVILEIALLNFSSIVPFSWKLAQLKLKGKDFLDEVWEGVRWYLENGGPQKTADQLVSTDLLRCRAWIKLQLQEAILEELVEDAILSFIPP